MSLGFKNSLKRELRRICSRPIYLVGMILVPIAMVLFFVGILEPSLPLKVPSGVVDLDGSKMSRNLTRQLNATELIDVKTKPLNYAEAMAQMREGEILGFFVIPKNFEKDAVSGNGPTLTYFYNLAIYVPGSLMFKGFKTMAVTSAGSLASTNIVSKGISGQMAGVALQPMLINIHTPGNPYLNYSYYLSPSFIMGIIELMVMIMAAFAVTQEIKRNSVKEWLATGNNRIGSALVGKLLPQTVIFSVIGWGSNVLLYHVNHFPMLGNELWLFIGMFLMVVASQSFAVIICTIVPNPRFALSLCCLSGILAFSLAAISFPVQAMYGGIAPFTYILPMRWYFLIYGDIALNGFPVYYAKMYFVCLLIFPIVATLCAPILKRRMLKTVYVP